MRKTLALVHTVLLLTACQKPIEFNDQGWSETEDLNQYSYRKQMVGNLLSSGKLDGLSGAAVVDLLGAPDIPEDWQNSHVFTYFIVTEYGLDIDPIYSKNLVIELDSDGFVQSYEIREYSHGY